MFQQILALFLITATSNICLGQGWDPSKFKYDPGPNYELIWQDQFENVGPSIGIVNGQPAYAPNPKNWVYKLGRINGGLQNYTNSTDNVYVQDNQLTIVAQKEGFTSGMLSSVYLQQFTFGKFAAKLRTPYGKGMWPAWWLVGNAWDTYHLYWPTVGEIDILEMVGGEKGQQPGDEVAHGTVHWNNASNTMSPIHGAAFGQIFQTPDRSKLCNNSLVYWTEWTPTNISIGINEFTYFVYNTTNVSGSINPIDAWTGKWPFYMILNIAIGGSWPGSPDNTTVWPQKMIVDWVRVDQVKKDFSLY